MGNTTRFCIAVVDDDDKYSQSLGRMLRAAGMQPAKRTL
jgi:FixJ family two-component response regulator